MSSRKNPYWKSGRLPIIRIAVLKWFPTQTTTRGRVFVLTRPHCFIRPPGLRMTLRSTRRILLFVRTAYVVQSVVADRYSLLDLRLKEFRVVSILSGSKRAERPSLTCFCIDHYATSLHCRHLVPPGWTRLLARADDERGDHANQKAT